ncbi:SDR family NAD(P)-dependent oxidoreductase [Pseudonocardia spinosispora]|uniref:SDR family NAD(P)-dependent oxidoreductase n=1 Tax=Pseudonocardia spinosispora TaxID=103441 RepID=UPI00040081DE|nr:SDR family oxidoreductase [Pseudonocardia spinosispora]
MGVAIVTGGSSGIGQATAFEIAARGHGVILTYNGNERGARDTVGAIEERGGTAVALRLDLAESARFPAFVSQVRDALASVWPADRLTALVNNAGLGGGSPFVETTEEQFDSMGRALFRGTYFLTQHVLALLADGGAIVNVTSASVTTIERGGGYTVYAANKAAVNTFTQYLAVELAERGIRVNAIAPGATRTLISDNAFGRYAHLVPEIEKKTLLGRLGEPEDIAAVIAMLLSRDGRWITGQIIEASGGYQFGI